MAPRDGRLKHASIDSTQMLFRTADGIPDKSRDTDLFSRVHHFPTRNNNNIVCFFVFFNWNVAILDGVHECLTQMSKADYSNPQFDHGCQLVCFVQTLKVLTGSRTLVVERSPSVFTAPRSLGIGQSWGKTAVTNPAVLRRGNEQGRNQAAALAGRYRTKSSSRLQLKNTNRLDWVI